METYFPKYKVFEGGEHFYTTKLYEALWKYHLYLFKKWKEKSPKKSEGLRMAQIQIVLQVHLKKKFTKITVKYGKLMVKYNQIR